MFAILCVPVLACFGPMSVAIAIYCMLYMAGTDTCTGTTGLYYTLPLYGRLLL